MNRTYLLLELLVDGIHGVFDRDAFHVAGGDGEAAGPDQIDLLERWCAEWNFEEVWVCDC